MLMLQQKFFSFLDSNNVPMEKRGSLISYLLASTLANCTPLPSSPVDAPKRYYMEMYAPVNDSKIASINEQIVIDYDTVSKLTMDLWLLRYRLLHEPRQIDVRKFIDALTAAGVSLVPEKYSELLRTCNSDTLNAMRDIFEMALVENGDAV